MGFNGVTTWKKSGAHLKCVCAHIEDNNAWNNCIMNVFRIWPIKIHILLNFGWMSERVSRSMPFFYSLFWRTLLSTAGCLHFGTKCLQWGYLAGARHDGMQSTLDRDSLAAMGQRYFKRKQNGRCVYKMNVTFLRV